MQPARPAQSVLVTGGAGFIGSHLVERLLAEGLEVRVLDDLSTGCAANLAGAAHSGRLDLREGSVLDEPSVASALEGIDLVFHLAANVGVMRVARDPARSIHTQVRGTELVLRHAGRVGAALLLASSSEVYGKGVKLPFAEEDDLLLGPPSQPRWSYACSKAADESLALAEPRVPAIVARLFNTVGPRQLGDHGMVLPRFVAQGLRGEALTVFGSGEQRRCFAGVAEVVTCLCRLAREPSAWGGVFNVGSDREVSIADLAALVRARTGGRSEIVQVPYEAAYGPGFEDLGRRVPDLRRLEAAIGLRPRREIEDLVDEVIAFSRSAPACRWRSAAALRRCGTRAGSCRSAGAPGTRRRARRASGGGGGVGRHDLGDGNLAEVRVLPREHAAAAHAGHRVEHGLDLLAEELHARHVDAVPAPAGEVQVAVGVEPALVAGAEAVGLEHRARREPGVEVGVEAGPGRGCRPRPCAPASVGAGDRPSVLAAQPDLVVGQRPAEARRASRRRARGSRRAGRPR